jgi:hypothetical protein
LRLKMPLTTAASISPFPSGKRSASAWQKSTFRAPPAAAARVRAWPN